MKDEKFAPVHSSTLRLNTKIFGSCFIEEFKKLAETLKKKSRLVAQNYVDDGASEIAAKDPTVKRFSQRIELSMKHPWQI